MKQTSSAVIEFDLDGVGVVVDDDDDLRRDSAGEGCEPDGEAKNLCVQQNE